MAIAVWGLARGLPPETFFVGDPGVKLIAARNALSNPTRPFEIPLPKIAGEPVPYVEPFFAEHQGHAHAVTSELFPLITAPLLAVFGMRGLYILPAAGFLLALAACAWLGVALDNRRSAPLLLTTGFLTTPWLFYGLEFWEHAPALGLATAATALLVRSVSVGDTLSPVKPLGGAFRSGLLFGLATLLRPETLCFFLAVLLCARFLPMKLGLGHLAIAFAGCAIALLPLAAYTWLHFGSPLTPHLAGNPGFWSAGWLARLWIGVPVWFLSFDAGSFWRVAPAMPLALVPFWSESERRGRSFLLGLAALSVLFVVLAAPNNGGGQWGPRYLLLVYAPLSILLADAVQALARHRPAGVLVTILVFAGSAWTDRAAYLELQAAKRIYGRVVTFVEEEIDRGGIAVTDLWWLDQVAAVLTDTRTILFARDRNTASEAARRLDQAETPAVTLFLSETESGGSVESWTRGTCFTETARAQIPERSLQAVRLRRRCP